MSIIGSTSLSDHNWATASNQFAQPVLGSLCGHSNGRRQSLKRQIEKLARQLLRMVVNIPVVQLPFHSRQERREEEVCARSRRSAKERRQRRYRKLHRNVEPAMAMVRKFEERAEEKSHSQLANEATKYAEEMGPQLQPEYPNPTFMKHDSVELGLGTEDMGSGT